MAVRVAVPVETRPGEERAAMVRRSGLRALCRASPDKLFGGAPRDIRGVLPGESEKALRARAGEVQSRLLLNETCVRGRWAPVAP